VNPIDPTGALSELSTTLTSGTDMAEILDRVVHLVQKYLPGAEQSSITLIRGTKAATAASTGPLPIELDEIQYAQGYGPCLDAGRNDSVMHIDDMATEQRWPAYTPLAVQHGVHSSLSLPLPVESYLVGALNTYATRKGAFDRESIAVGTALAAHITAALSFAESAHGHRLRAENLAKAMRSRDVIEQAKGMIMAQQKCSAEAAFQLLRKLSMDENIKLQDLAVSVVSSASGHPVRLPESE
jgi:GAF domain-containing protein